MEKIITATGKEFSTDLVCTIPSPRMAYIRIIGSDLETVKEVFSNPNETKEIIYNNYRLVGFTKLGYVKTEDMAIKVRLEAS